jgi:hypothetical protein
MSLVAGTGRLFAGKDAASPVILNADALGATQDEAWGRAARLGRYSRYFARPSYWLLVGQRRVARGRELDELLRQRELVPLAPLDAARLARHPREEDGDARSLEGRKVLGH